MDDDKLKSTFSDYNPELSSDFDFLGRVQQRMRYVDLIKQESKATRRLNRKAMAIAATAGFIAGFLFSRAIPYITATITAWSQTLPTASTLRSVADYTPIIAWLLLATISVFTALTAYDLTSSQTKCKH